MNVFCMISPISHPFNSSISLTSGLFLCFTVAIYSTSSIFSKLASGYEFLSFPYLICLGGIVSVLGVYAVLWQMALKRVPLNQAYLFRSLGLIYGLCIAHFLFNERMTVQNIAGCCLVLTGMLILLSKK